MLPERNVENSRKIEILQLLIKLQNQSALAIGQQTQGTGLPGPTFHSSISYSYSLGFLVKLHLFLILFLVFVELNIEVQIIMKEFD